MMEACLLIHSSPYQNVISSSSTFQHPEHVLGNLLPRGFQSGSNSQFSEDKHQYSKRRIRKRFTYFLHTVRTLKVKNTLLVSPPGPDTVARHISLGNGVRVMIKYHLSTELCDFLKLVPRSKWLNKDTWEKL